MAQNQFDTATATGALPAIKWPFGIHANITAADIAAANTAVAPLTISNNVTVIDTGVLGAALTFGLAVAEGLQDGAAIYLLTESDTTARAVTLTGSILTGAITGTISKKKVTMLVLLNGLFTQVSTTTLN
jgi:hypothetical protein